MKKLSIILALVLVVSVSSLGLAAPFGESLEPMERTEMEEVDGEFKHIAAGAAAGAVFGTTSYMITTPRSRWTVSGAVRSALAGAVSGAGGASLR